MFIKGDRVKHPLKPEWGLGQVLSDNCNGGRISVFFMDAGEKTLMLSHVSLIKVDGEEADSIYLDNLAQDKFGKVKRFMSLQEAMENFTKLFPEGLHGSDHDSWERDYKLQGQKLIIELLNKPDFSRLIDKQEYSEACNRAMKVSNKLNLIFPNEKMALQDGLKIEANQQLFAESLYDLLYGEGETKQRFLNFADCLKTLGAAKWPIVSYFQFVRFPSEYMFIKPMVTQNVAATLSFEINYNSDLNWLTYDSVQKLAKYLKARLVEMKPRDMIDVQTFMWCIDPTVYNDYMKEKADAEASSREK